MRFLGCDIIRKGPGNSGQIAFTFDDGPHPKNTLNIVEILEEYEGQGTFFMTGENISNYRSIAKEISDRGHLLGNHTFSHPHALFTGRGKLEDEIKRSKDILEEITGEANRYFRPPYGFITLPLLNICRKLELSIVLWNSNSKDYRRKPAEQVVKRIENKIMPGSIMLFHECNFRDKSIDYSNSINALKSTLETAILKGLKPVTIESMFRI